MFIDNEKDPSLLEDDEEFARATEEYIEQKMDEVSSSVGDKHEWIQFCHEDGEKFFDDQDHWEYSYGLGDVTHARMIIHHLALTTAIQQVIESGQEM